MNNKQVAHLWANKSRTQASGSHFYFEGDTIYSYGSHFPIARHYKGVVLFTSKGYSSTTAKHKGYANAACCHLTRFTVSNVLQDPSGKDVREYGEQLKDMAQTAAKARNPERHLEALEQATEEANTFCALFGFKARFSMPANFEALQAKAKEASIRERKRKAERMAKQEQENAVLIAKWITGEVHSLPYSVAGVYLRTRLTEQGASAGAQWAMQTSKGAMVPLSEAQKAFRFVMLKRATGWHRNGEQFPIGEFHLDAVNEQGVVAGCHRVTWDEIERFAKSQNWI